MALARKTILVDMDEVLASYTDKVVRTLKEETGFDVDLEDIPGQRLSKVLPDAELAIVSEYPNRPGWFADLETISHSREVLARLWRNYEIVIVSAANGHPTSHESKLNWLAENFPFIDHKQVIFTEQKGKIIGDYLIDDQPRHLERFKTGTPLLFEAWHNLNEGRFHRLRTWHAVEQYFESR